MRLRPFGNTGINVSEIGLGTWQLDNPDWKTQDTSEAMQIIAKSLDAGCNFFDTAPAYGKGRSEELLGKALAAVRQEVIICTKFSHYYTDGSRDFDAANLRPELEGSLRRLRTDYVDILLIHSPPSELTDGRKASDLYAELEKLKVEGKIREYGVSLDLKIELETLLDTTFSKAAEVMYNVFYQEPSDAFAKAQENGMGLIVKVPLDSGWLSGRYHRDARFNDLRNRWPREVLERRASLVDQFAALVPEGVSLTHAALQFILAQPQVATVIPGAKSTAQALDNFSAAKQQLSPEVVQSMVDLWKRELQNNPLPW